MDAGMAGAVAGTVVGVMGGVVGTFSSIANAKGPRERALTIQLAAACWVWMAGLVFWLFVAPRPWGALAVLWGLPLLMKIPKMNRRLAQARAEDESEA
jgi:hypothetical protein